jgi:hypothetical protein
MLDRIYMLDVWVALGGDFLSFELWMDDPNRTPADAWAQLLAAIRGDLMAGDHNPGPGDELLALIEARWLG